MDCTKDEKKQWGDCIKSVLFVIGWVVVIAMFPFLYPIISNALIALGIIKNVEQIKMYIEMFKSFNIFIAIIMIVIVLYESDISISEIIEKIISNFDFNYKNGNSEIQLKHKNNILQNEATKMAKDVKKEAQEILFKDTANSNVINTKCQECKKEEIANERESLRYFSAYQITNKYSRNLLKEVKACEKMPIELFAYSLQEYYQKTIKNMGKKRKQEFITKKIEELLYNLRYLNIIEYTEDDKFIILTQNGKEFMNSYYNEEVG